MTQKHPEYNGPAMGPKMATENKRGFTAEDNRKMRDGSIGLQVNQKLTSVTFDFKIYSRAYSFNRLSHYLFFIFFSQAGQNQGATQAGHGGMGNTRHM